MIRLMLLFLGVACKEGGTGEIAKESVATSLGCDEDGDGYCVAEGDCQEGDPDRYPGALEACDGIDNDCDNDVDEGVLFTFYKDSDQDGFGDETQPADACEAPLGTVSDHTDCDDTNADVYPDAEEVCNGIDDDCDTDIDEGFLQPWYQDADEDGYGDPDIATVACEKPDGFVVDNTDCDDSTGRVWPGNPEACDSLDNDCNGLTDDGVTSTWYADFDGDKFGTSILTQQACVAPSGYVAVGGDCDDLNADVNPSIVESCNGVDDDCDGTVDEPDATGVQRWYLDGDADGYGDAGQYQDLCDMPLGYVGNAQDCDDAVYAVNPSATEICDGVDNDCDGTADQNAVDARTWYVDLDGDTYGSMTVMVDSCTAPTGYVATSNDCNDATAEAHPGATEICDRLDNDCDGTVDQNAVDASLWYQDLDGDNFGDPSYPLLSCNVPSGYTTNDLDCDDGNLNVHPSAPEYCNGVDDNCDGTTDESAVDATRWYLDADGDGYGDQSSLYECSAPAGYVTNNMDCDDGNGQVYPGADEYCNAADDDCDGKVDEGALDQLIWYGDGDGDGHGLQTVPTLGCTAPTGYVALSDDCNDANGGIFPGASEYCNNVDDDCDAQVDEADAVDATVWYLDADGDAYGNPRVYQSSCSQPSGWITDGTDCDDADALVYPGASEDWYDGVDGDCDGNLDPDACVESPPAGTISTDPSCAYTPPGTFNPGVEWSMSTFATYASYKNVIMSPMIGQLTDDNNDGKLNELDTPDIAVVAYNSASDAVLRVLSGTGLVEHWSVYTKTYNAATYAPYRYSNLALGDIDLDGSPDIVATVVNTSNSNCYVGAYSNAGALKWVYTGATVRCSSHAPALADLEGDGDVEVIMGRLIINGNGTLQAQGAGGYGYYASYSNAGYMSVAADIDGDGKQEVLAGSSVYNADGSTKCSTGTTDGYPGVANLDSDSQGEFVVVAGGTIKVFDTNCSQLYSYAVYGGGSGGPPTIADYDGDGTPEIGLPGTAYYTVYEINGTRLWSKAITDASSGSTGSSVFDFDGDGRAEVVYADETMVWVLDGTTGAVDLQSSMHTSGTVNEYPVVADVDNDGNTEIIFGNNGTTTGVVVLGDVNDAWVSARTVWNQHAYSIVNINDDLSIPTTPDPNWPDYNSFRQGGFGSLSPDDAPNLSLESWGSCQSACAQDVDVILQVLNDGLIRADSGTSLVLYGEDASGNRTELDRTTLGSALGAGARSSAYTFTVTATEVLNYSKLVASVDADGISNECDETDNEVVVDTTGVCN